MRFNRIPENSISVMGTETTNYHAIVSQPVSGVFKLTQFAYWQIIAGAKNFAHFSDELKGHGLSNVLHVISSLSMAIMSSGSDMAAHEVQLLRGEVEIMKGLLDARMRHCEHQRDDNNESFNPDTYISQKLLLLDIREWLMCHSIQIGELVKEEKPRGSKVYEHIPKA